VGECIPQGMVSSKNNLHVQGKRLKPGFKSLSYPEIDIFSYKTKAGRKIRTHINAENENILSK